MHAVFRNTLRTDWRQVLCAGRLNDFVCHQEQEVHQEKTVASEPKCNEGSHGSMHFQIGIQVVEKLARYMNATPHAEHTSHLVAWLAYQTCFDSRYTH